MSRGKEEDIPVVVTKMYDLSLWMLQKTEKFPRSYKFSLGDRLAGFSLDLQVALVEAAYAIKKDSLLDFASRRVNGMRYLLRMAKDLKLLTVDSYGFAAERLDEIGRMVGGWRKTAGGRALIKRAGNLSRHFHRTWCLPECAHLTREHESGFSHRRCQTLSVA